MFSLVWSNGFIIALVASSHLSISFHDSTVESEILTKIGNVRFCYVMLFVRHKIPKQFDKIVFYRVSSRVIVAPIPLRMCCRVGGGDFDLSRHCLISLVIALSELCTCP